MESLDIVASNYTTFICTFCGIKFGFTENGSTLVTLGELVDGHDGEFEIYLDYFMGLFIGQGLLICNTLDVMHCEKIYVKM